MRLGQLPLGKIPPWEVSTWEKFVGKVSNIKLNNPVNPVILVQYFLLYCWLSGHLRNVIFETHVTKPAGYLLQTKGKEGEGRRGVGFVTVIFNFSTLYSFQFRDSGSNLHVALHLQSGRVRNF